MEVSLKADSDALSSIMKTELIIPSLQQIVNFFKEETVDQIAKETGFSNRKRKLSPIIFLGLFTFGLIQSLLIGVG